MNSNKDVSQGRVVKSNYMWKTRPARFRSIRQCLVAAILLFTVTTPALSEKLDLLGFTPGMRFQEAASKFSKFKFCQDGISPDGAKFYLCDNKFALLFSNGVGTEPILLSARMMIRTTDTEATVLADISKQFDNRPFLKNTTPVPKDSPSTSKEYINYYYWTLPQGLELQYEPDHGILQPAPASGTIVLQSADLMQRHKDEMVRQSRRSVPKL